MKTHGRQDEVGNVICHHCGRSFGSKRGLLHHQSTQHPLPIKDEFLQATLFNSFIKQEPFMLPEETTFLNVKQEPIGK